MPNSMQRRAAIALVIVLAIVVPGGIIVFPETRAQERNDPNEFYKLRTDRTTFRYYELGHHAPSRSGRKPYPLSRFVVAPNIGLPIRVDPKNGIHMYCNSQVYGLGGFLRPRGANVPTSSVNSPANYQFPWTSNFCEKRGRRGSTMQLQACGTRYVEHLGQDCRPGRPINRSFQGIAVDGGLVSGLGKGHLVSVSNTSHLWTYLHMDKRVVRKNQVVRKGQRLGLVSDRPGNTSVHLHLEVQMKGPDGFRYMDPLPSLIVAYRRALGHDVTELIDQDGNLKFDPEFEIRAGEGEAQRSSEPCASALNQPSIGSEARFKFVSFWCHNNSVMGLVETGTERQLVYVRPRATIAQNAAKSPILVSAAIHGGEWRGNAFHFSSLCGGHRFPVTGVQSLDSSKLILTGLRDSFQNVNCDSVKVAEKLVFQRIDLRKNPAITQGRDDNLSNDDPAPPLPTTARLSCPYALKTGEMPKQAAGKIFPSKSERTCNFLALTLPKETTLAEMPRYIREWPGLNPAGFLRDKRGDRIIAFKSEQSGIGAWWYWLLKRARNRSKPRDYGFGATGRLTLSQLALAMSGHSRMDITVRKTYLKPYLQFARQYFNRAVGEEEAIDIADPDARWNLARIQFHLESGRPILTRRASFECGIRLGNDVMADFDAADVEEGSQKPIRFVHFKGLGFYAHACRTEPGKSINQVGPLAGTKSERSDLHLAQTRIAEQQKEIASLKADLKSLMGDVVALKDKVAVVKATLQKVIANLQ